MTPASDVIKNGQSCTGDFNGDDSIGVNDLLAVVDNWGICV